MHLSNSFIEDLEKVGKFYEKHKEYIRSNSKKTPRGGLVLYYIPVTEQLILNKNLEGANNSNPQKYFKKDWSPKYLPQE